MLTFAFYHARPGKFTDRVIRRASGSVYSHVEFVMRPPNRDGKSFCISASKRDGSCVRAKRFELREGHWDLLTIDGDYDAARKFAIAQLNTPYNIWGALASITPCHAKIGKGLFCSQFMGLIGQAGGLDIADPHTLTPGEFYDILEAHERIKQVKVVANDRTS